MSRWSYIIGTIRVIPYGASQPEKDYVLHSVLNHLPRINGSEGQLNTYVQREKGYNLSSNCDEFGNFSNLGTGYFKSFQTQDNYLITVEASLRDRSYDETLKEFMKWLNRLSKRVIVDEILVEISDSWGYKTVLTTERCHHFLFENFDREDRWTDRLFETT